MSMIDLTFRKTSANAPGDILLRDTSLFVPGVAGGFVQGDPSLIPGTNIGDPAYDTDIIVQTRYATKGQLFTILDPPSTISTSPSTIGVLFIWTLSSTSVGQLQLTVGAGAPTDVTTQWSSLGRIVNGGYACQIYFQHNRNYSFGTRAALQANTAAGVPISKSYLVYKNVEKLFTGIGNIDFQNTDVDIGGVQATPISNTSNVLSPTTNPISTTLSLTSVFSTSTMVLAPNSLGVGCIMAASSFQSGAHAWTVNSSPGASIYGFNSSASGGWYVDVNGFTGTGIAGSNFYSDKVDIISSDFNTTGAGTVPTFTNTKMEMVMGANTAYNPSGITTGTETLIWTPRSAGGATLTFSPSTPSLASPMWDICLQAFVEIKGYFSYP